MSDVSIHPGDHKQWCCRGTWRSLCPSHGQDKIGHPVSFLTCFPQIILKDLHYCPDWQLPTEIASKPHCLYHHSYFWHLIPAFIAVLKSIHSQPMAGLSNSSIEYFSHRNPKRNLSWVKKKALWIQCHQNVFQMACELLILKQNLQNIHGLSQGSDFTQVKPAVGWRPNHGHMTESSKLIWSTEKCLDDKNLIVIIKQGNCYSISLKFFFSKGIQQWKNNTFAILNQTRV